MKVIMPRIGMTMQDAKITKWYQSDGSKIVQGEPMLDIETEKLTNTIVSPATGVIHHISKEYEIVKCGDDIAEIIE